jgi:signal transduction histidine kinase
MQYGLVKSLEDYLMHLSHIDSLKVEFKNEIQPSDINLLDKQALLNTYRMCLELLNNIIKHAQANFLKMSLLCHDQAVHIQLTHNGKGVTNEEMEQFTQNSKGLGLKSLQARTLIINATLNYTKQTDTSIVTLSIPLPL